MSVNQENDSQYELLNENISYCDEKFKIIIIGSEGVGKSCLTIQATRKKFMKNNPTLGFDYSVFNMKIDEKIIKLKIWDTCGQDIYKSLISNYYKQSSLAIIVYAINK